MDDQDYLKLSFSGFIAGPKEHEKSFLKRCRCKTFPLKLVSFGLKKAPLKVVYQNQGLRFWEAAAVFSNKEKSFIQLKTVLKNKSTLFKIYNKEEILSHEAVHFIRQQFNENRFEEILAYQTSSSRFRRLLGPLFKTPKESLFFLITVCGGVFGSLFFPFSLLFPSFLSLYLLIRLCVDRFLFSKALKAVEPHVNCKPLFALLHMKDEEIVLCAKQGFEVCKKNIPPSVRSKQIAALLKEKQPM